MSHAQPSGDYQEPRDARSPDGDGGATEDDPRWRLTPTKIVVTAILIFAIVTPLLVSTYDQINPRLFGFPFFYWYQLAWVFLAAGCCSVSFFLLKRESDAYHRNHPGQAATDRSGNGGER